LRKTLNITETQHTMHALSSIFFFLSAIR